MEVIPQIETISPPRVEQLFIGFYFYDWIMWPVHTILSLMWASARPLTAIVTMLHGHFWIFVTGIKDVSY